MTASSTVSGAFGSTRAVPASCDERVGKHEAAVEREFLVSTDRVASAANDGPTSRRWPPVHGALLNRPVGEWSPAGHRRVDLEPTTAGGSMSGCRAGSRPRSCSRYARERHELTGRGARLAPAARRGYRHRRNAAGLRRSSDARNHSKRDVVVRTGWSGRIEPIPTTSPARHAVPDRRRTPVRDGRRSSRSPWRPPAHNAVDDGARRVAGSGNGSAGTRLRRGEQSHPHALCTRTCRGCQK